MRDQHASLSIRRVYVYMSVSVYERPTPSSIRRVYVDKSMYVYERRTCIIIN